MRTVEEMNIKKVYTFLMLMDASKNKTDRPKLIYEKLFFKCKYIMTINFNLTIKSISFSLY